MISRLGLVSGSFLLIMFLFFSDHPFSLQKQDASRPRDESVIAFQRTESRDPASASGRGAKLTGDSRSSTEGTTWLTSQEFQVQVQSGQISPSELPLLTSAAEKEKADAKFQAELTVLHQANLKVIEEYQRENPEVPNLVEKFALNEKQVFDSAVPLFSFNKQLVNLIGSFFMTSSIAASVKASTSWDEQMQLVLTLLQDLKNIPGVSPTYDRFNGNLSNASLSDLRAVIQELYTNATGKAQLFSAYSFGQTKAAGICENKEYGAWRNGWDYSFLNWGPDVTIAQRNNYQVDAGSLLNFDFPLKTHLPCVKQQGKRGTCSAFSLAAALETLTSLNYQKKVNLSEQAIYYQGKQVWGPVTPDDGYHSHNYLKQGIREEFIFPFEWAWLYNPSPKLQRDTAFRDACAKPYDQACSETPGQGERVCTRSSNGAESCGYRSRAFNVSQGVKVKKYVNLLQFDSTEHSMKLASYLLMRPKSPIPIIVSVYLKEGFSNFPSRGPDGRAQSAAGIIQMPGVQSKALGGHAMLAVGFIPDEWVKKKWKDFQLDTGGGYFVVRNSWDSWGSAGYAFVPLKFMSEHTYAMVAATEIELILPSGS